MVSIGGAVARAGRLDDLQAAACFEAAARLLGRPGHSAHQVLRALDASDEVVMLVDRERRIVGHNRRLTQLTGYASHDVLGRRCGEGLRSWDCGRGCRLFTEGLVCGRRCDLEASGGKRLRAIKTAMLLRAHDGTVVGGFERLQVLGEAEDGEGAACVPWPATTTTAPLLEATMSLRGEAELAVGSDGELIGISHAARRLLRLGVEAMTPQLVWSLFAQPAELQRAFDAVVAMGAPRAVEDVKARSGCDAALHVDLAPLRDRHGDVLGVSFRLREEEPGACGEAMVGESPPMRRLHRAVRAVAKRDVTVLITGESGSGKEVVARALHRYSGRADKPFHAINCAALGEELLESELFGHERGAFTNAFRDKRGRLELCGDGTLFLDEVACLTPKMQAKLLRVLEQREFERVGGTETLHLRARIVSATNAALWPLVQAGTFREDLYYRLCVVPLEVPPLRERRGDIVRLARHLLAGMVAPDVAPPTFGVEVEQVLEAHAWPGNVRELRNALEYALAMGDGRAIRLDDLPAELVTRAATGRGGERARLEEALAAARYNREEAARLLGVSRTTLWRRMRALGLR